MTPAWRSAGLVRFVARCKFTIAAESGDIVRKSPSAGRSGRKHYRYPKVDVRLTKLLGTVRQNQPRKCDLSESRKTRISHRDTEDTESVQEIKEDAAHSGKIPILLFSAFRFFLSPLYVYFSLCSLSLWRDFFSALRVSRFSDFAREVFHISTTRPSRSLMTWSPGCTSSCS
jgi:hypothetical protein